MPTIQQGRQNRPGARRTAGWRARRRRGFRCVAIKICDADVTGLIANGLLDRLHRDDQTSVEAAIGVLLDRLGR